MPLGPTEQRGGEGGVLAEPALHPVEGPLHVAPPAVGEHGELPRPGRDQAGGLHAQQPDPPPGPGQRAIHLGGHVVDFRGDVGGSGECP